MSEPDFSKFSNQEIVDGHMHFESIPLITETKKFLGALSINKLAIASYGHPDKVNSNPQAICFKAEYPSDTYIMGGLDYSDIDKDFGQIEKDFVVQAEKLMQIGFDGVKLLETKPTLAKQMPFGIDDPVYNSFFGFLQEKQIPIVWHVADPEEMWTEEGLCPVAKAKGWDYGDGSYPSKEDLYASAENVLQRFPVLKVIFAHFYFLSADLPRAARLLDKYPQVNLDITPGTEMYLNFSKTSDQSREFFTKYQDRILFGDDTGVREKGVAKKGITEKIYFMRNFLETEETFAMPQGDECFLHREGIIKGIRLSESIQDKIYSKNFLRIVGEKPCALDSSSAKEECHRIGEVLEKKYRFPKESNFGYEAEEFLASNLEPTSISTSCNREGK